MDFGIASLIGSGISALGGLVGSNVSYNTSKKLLDRQNQYNRDMADLAYERDLDMWNRQNAYNSPVEQISRLKEAGLNPVLMYGSGSSATGNASNAPSYNAPTSDIQHYNGDFGISQAANAVSNGINSYISTQRQLAEIRATDAATSKTNADTNLSLLRAIGQQRANAKSDIELRYLDDIERQTLENLEQTNINLRANSQFTDQRRLQFEAERPLKLQLVQEALTQNKFLNSLNPLTKRHLSFRIANLASQYTGRELENRVLQTLVDTGVNLKGGVMERAVNQILNMIDNEEFSWQNLGKALSVGAIGFLTK